MMLVGPSTVVQLLEIGPVALCASLGTVVRFRSPLQSHQVAYGRTATQSTRRMASSA